MSTKRVPDADRVSEFQVTGGLAYTVLDSKLGIGVKPTTRKRFPARLRRGPAGRSVSTPSLYETRRRISRPLSGTTVHLRCVKSSITATVNDDCTGLPRAGAIPSTTHSVGLLVGSTTSERACPFITSLGGCHWIRILPPHRSCHPTRISGCSISGAATDYA